jgi:hypothetical protein
MVCNELNSSKSSKIASSSAGSAAYLVFGVDKLNNNALVFAADSLHVGVQLKHYVVSVAWERAVYCRSHIATQYRVLRDMLIGG